jgi:hypothetical protein
MKITLELRAISHKSPMASWGSNVYFFEDGACYPDQHTGNGLGWCSKEDIKKAIEEAQLAEKEKVNAGEPFVLNHESLIAAEEKLQGFYGPEGFLNPDAVQKRFEDQQGYLEETIESLKEHLDNLEVKIDKQNQANAHHFGKIMIEVDYLVRKVKELEQSKDIEFEGIKSGVRQTLKRIDKLEEDVRHLKPKEKVSFDESSISMELEEIKKPSHSNCDCCEHIVKKLSDVCALCGKEIIAVINPFQEQIASVASPWHPASEPPEDRRCVMVEYENYNGINITRALFRGDVFVYLDNPIPGTPIRWMEVPK